MTFSLKAKVIFFWSNHKEGFGALPSPNPPESWTKSNQTKTPFVQYAVFVFSLKILSEETFETLDVLYVMGIIL